MKDTFFMSIMGLAAIFDAVKNYLSNAPVNVMGVLLLSVVCIYFIDIVKEHFRS